MEWFKEIIEKAYSEENGLDLEMLMSEFNTKFYENAVLREKYDELNGRYEESENERNRLSEENEKIKNEGKTFAREKNIELALTRAGARNLKATRALINVGDEADEEAIEEIIRGLKEGEDTSFLFEQKRELFGNIPEDSIDSNEKSLDEMSYSEMIRYMNGE